MLVSDPSMTPTLSLLLLLHHQRLDQGDRRPEPDTSHHITPLLLLDSAELTSSAEGGTSYITPDEISVV